MGALRHQDLGADSAEFETLGLDAATGYLLGILRHELLEAGLGSFMFAIGRSRSKVGCRQF